MTNAIAPAAAEAVLTSLDLLAAHGEDPTVFVYERLYALHPEYRTRFAHELDEATQGAMLAKTITAMLDFLADPRAGGYELATEMVTHEGYDVPREAFVSFFEVVRDVARDSLADAWTPAFEAGWAELVRAIEAHLGGVLRSDVAYAAGVR